MVGLFELFSGTFRQETFSITVRNKPSLFNPCPAWHVINSHFAQASGLAGLHKQSRNDRCDIATGVIPHSAPHLHMVIHSWCRVVIALADTWPVCQRDNLFEIQYLVNVVSWDWPSLRAAVCVDAMHVPCCLSRWF